MSLAQRHELIGSFAWIDAGMPGADSPAFFENGDEMRDAWQIHGPQIMRAWRTLFMRPRGWWLYERGETPPPTAVAEMGRLRELGELTAQELEWAAERGA